MKIQWKITLLFTLVCLSLIVMLSVAVYYIANERAFQDFYTRLELRAVISAKINFDVSEQNQEAYETLRKQHVQRLPNEEEFIIRIDTVDKIGHSPLFERTGPDFFNSILRNNKASLRHNFEFYEGILHEAPNNGQRYFIIVSATNGAAQSFLDNLKKILTTVCVVATIVVFIIGILFSRQVLAPIRNITRKVNNISITNLHERLAEGKGSDEISVLAATFNDMLSRLETAFETQNNFVSNASHELNTPLTAIIGEADYAMAKPRAPEQYNNSLQVIMSEAQKLQAVTRGLLELAQSSFSDRVTQEGVRIDELIHNCYQVARNVYPNTPIHIDESLSPADRDRALVYGNAQLFELAVSNVLLNACKYSGDRPVTVAYGLTTTHCHIIVSDNGIGIPENELKHIYDPFFRASNTKKTKGYGIGLPLARNIIRLYKGEIIVSSHENVGTEVVIKFPL